MLAQDGGAGEPILPCVGGTTGVANGEGGTSGIAGPGVTRRIQSTFTLRLVVSLGSLGHEGIIAIVHTRLRTICA